MVKRRKKPEAPVQIGTSIHDLLTALGGSRPRSRLDELWHAWPEVLGAGLGAWIKPLGARGHVLLLAAQDAMEMQEMHYVSGDVLERVNLFLRERYFTSVRIELSGEGKICPDQMEAPAASPPPQQAAAAPSGKYLAAMVRTSPVYACYARFAAKNR